MISNNDKLNHNLSAILSALGRYATVAFLFWATFCLFKLFFAQFGMFIGMFGIMCAIFAVSLIIILPFLAKH